MLKIPAKTTTKWLEKVVHDLISAVSFIVFAFFDLLDIVFCLFYKLLDGFTEEKTKTITSCNCEDRGGEGRFVNGDVENELSETLYQRKNIFKDLGNFIYKLMVRKEKEDSNSMEKDGLMVKNSCSDPNSGSCLSSKKLQDQKLHVVVKEPSQANNEDSRGKPIENVIFLHGFISSSSYWTKTVFPNLFETGNQNYRLFAVDLLGFGNSPKPKDCLYTLKDHLEMVERSVINQFQLESFHLVAHSMGCIIALAIAAKYKTFVKSITLVAPAYFPSSKEKASSNTLNKLAERRLRAPFQFGTSVMSWYKHLGRTIYFIGIKNYRTWEWLLRLLTCRRDLSFSFMDGTRHTHHSAWHTMHNVVCGGAKLMDEYLEAVNSSKTVLTIIQGDKDPMTPLECSQSMKLKVPSAEVQIIPDANHNSIIHRRRKAFTNDLEQIWSSIPR